MYKVKTKIWKKIFDVDTIDQIFKQAEKVIPYKTFDEDISSATSNGNYFAHLETDIENDTIGVSPKQIKSFLEKNEIAQIGEMLVLLTYLGLKNKDKYVDGDRQLNWKGVFNDYMSGKTIQEVIISLKLKADIKKRAQENIFWLFLDSPDFNFKKKYALKADLWKETYKMVPKDEMLCMFVMPLNFNKKKSGELAKEYGAINTLDNFKKFLNIQLLRSPYDNSSFIYSNAFYNEESLTAAEQAMLSNLSESAIESIDIKSFSRDFKDYKYFNELIADLNDAAKASQSLVGKIRNFHAGLNTFITRVSFISGIIEEEVEEFALRLPRRVKSEIANRYGSSDIIGQYYRVWKDRAESNLFSGELTIGKYTISILESDNPEQLVLGEMTDCCQLIGGEGQGCLISGLENESQGFVKVEKNGQVYAQSWFWTHEDVLCFDSIELPPSDNQDKIIELYVAFAKKLAKKYKFKVVYAGRDGNRVPKKVLDLPVEDTSYKDFFDDKVYSDTIECGVAVLYEKDK